MQIKRIAIKNFRAIRDQIIELEPYNTFVGANGSGKSTVLNALNLFFGELDGKRISDRDVHNKNTSETIEISVTFSNLSEKEKTEFKHYVRANELTIVAEISIPNCSPVKVIKGERLVFPPFTDFHDGESASARATIFNKLREEYPDLQNATNDTGRKETLSEYEEQLPETEKKFIRSEDKFFGATKGQGKLQKFVKWVYVPAVKDASNEGEENRSSYLSKLMGVVVRQRLNHQEKLEEIQKSAVSSFNEMLREQKHHLEDLNQSLSQRLRDAFTGDVKLNLTWKEGDDAFQIPEPEATIELKDQNFEGKVDNFGHGLQRTFLIILLQEIATLEAEDLPTLILGCEEPELYQHPTQARHLAKVLGALAGDNAQVLVTSHNPNFVNVEYFEGIRRFSNTMGTLRITSSKFTDLWSTYNEVSNTQDNSSSMERAQLEIRAKLAIRTLPKFNDVFFMERAVLVEGISDQACFNSLIDVREMRDQFQRPGIDILSCDGKSNIVFLKLIADAFEIPNFVVFDCDGDVKNPAAGAKHERDNNALFKLCKYKLDEGFPDSDLVENDFVAWKTNIEAVIEADCGGYHEAAKHKASVSVGQFANAKKNPLYVAALVREAAQSGCDFPLLSRALKKMLGMAG